jgi:signal transduction histidine kinase
MPSPQRARAAVRVGHVYLDVPRRSLRLLNPAATQLRKEGVPILAHDLVPGALRTPDGATATAADLPLYVAWREGRPVEATFLLTRPDGSVWHVVWSVSPVWGDAARLEGVLATVSYGSAQPDPDRLAELAHDLRTPLQALGLQCAVLQQLAPSGADLTNGLGLLRSASERATRIATELLDCCRGSSPRARQASRDWFALGPFLKGLAEEQEVAARAKGLALGTELNAAFGWEVHSEPVQLGRLLGNLLVNAVRYTPRGGIALRAAWRQEPGEQLLEVSVTDTGPGISREEQESIFQAYERGRAGRDSDSGGSGLGLAVVDRLVEELGLRVEVESITGRGSTFIVLVPSSLLRRAEG